MSHQDNNPTQEPPATKQQTLKAEALETQKKSEQALKTTEQGGPAANPTAASKTASAGVKTEGDARCSDAADGAGGLEATASQAKSGKKPSPES